MCLCGCGVWVWVGVGQGCYVHVLIGLWSASVLYNCSCDTWYDFWLTCQLLDAFIPSLLFLSYLFSPILNFSRLSLPPILHALSLLPTPPLSSSSPAALSCPLPQLWRSPSVLLPQTTSLPSRTNSSSTSVSLHGKRRRTSTFLQGTPSGAVHAAQVPSSGPAHAQRCFSTRLVTECCECYYWLCYSFLCRFKTPDIDIVIGDGSSSKVAVGNSTDVTATFTNLLPVPLTKVQWFVEGSGLTEPLKIVGR